MNDESPVKNDERDEYAQPLQPEGAWAFPYVEVSLGTVMIFLTYVLANIVREPFGWDLILYVLGYAYMAWRLVPPLFDRKACSAFNRTLALEGRVMTSGIVVIASAVTFWMERSF